jgi:hypothetical protein
MRIEADASMPRTFGTTFFLSSRCGGALGLHRSHVARWRVRDLLRKTIRKRKFGDRSINS